MQPHHPVAEVQHLPRRVGDEENRLALRPEMPHPRHALLREARIAHAQRLIHNQDFGVHVGGNGESQPGAHSAGIRPQGLVDVHANIRKINNLLLDLGDFALLHAHQHTLIGNVFAPSQLVIHADVCRQHTDRAADLAEPQIRLGDARDDTRQRRFAGAVQPRQPDDFAAVEVLRHAAERRKFLHVRPKTQQRLQAVFFPRRTGRRPSSVPCSGRLHPPSASPPFLRDFFLLDGADYSWSMKRFRSRMCSVQPAASSASAAIQKYAPCPGDDQKPSPYSRHLR